VLADHFLRAKDANQQEGGALTERVHRGYERLMRRFSRGRHLLLFAIVPLVLLAWIAYQRVGSGFMPVMDEGGFILDYRAQSGTSLSETDRLAAPGRADSAGRPPSADLSRRTGLQLGGGITEATRATSSFA